MYLRHILLRSQLHFLLQYLQINHPPQLLHQVSSHPHLPSGHLHPNQLVSHLPCHLRSYRLISHRQSHPLPALPSDQHLLLLPNQLDSHLLRALCLLFILPPRSHHVFQLTVRPSDRLGIRPFNHLSRQILPDQHFTRHSFHL